MKSICLAIAIFWAGVVSAQDLRLWYRQPAQIWTEALPIGNGDLGAMIFGGVGEDHLQLNVSTWWTGRPRSYQLPGAGQYLDTIRQLLFAGKQADAEALAQEHFMGRKDPDEKTYDSLKTAWFKKVRGDTAWAMVPADDHWSAMTLPTLNGWETAGLEGVDGAIWFQHDFDLPADWAGKDLSIDLGRIRDMDFTYINGHLIGSAEGISTKRHYTIPATNLHSGRNHIAIQVLNFDDKGGFTGLKGDKPPFVLYPAGATTPLRLDAVWKYRIQDQRPPSLPKYEAEYQPFGDLYLQIPGAHPQDYLRELELKNAISRVSYTDNGVHYTREYFSSAPGKAIVIHLTADRPGHVSFHAALKTIQREYAIHRIDAHTMELSEKVKEGVLRGVAFLHIETKNGRNNGIDVTNADEALIILTAATSFVNYHDVSADPEAICRARIAALQGRSWVSLRDAHLRDYQPRFNTFSIRFGASDPEIPTDQRILQYTPASDANFIALYMQYARYLMLSSSSSKAAYPANLQGLWNDELSPPWGSKYTTNINLEMNYWPAEPLNLSTCSAPLFRLIENLSQAGKATAGDYYHARGWVLHHNTDLWCGTAAINASNHGIWPTGGAWLCHQIWEHYEFTHDKAFLRQYYPMMRAAANFFVDFLIADPVHGWLISTPSASPEHGGLVAGPTMDHQIIRDLFRNCIASARILGLDQAETRIWQEKYNRIAPNQVGRYGQLQEWLGDKDDTADTHRHISHLWGVYPGTDITWKDSALMKAARRSLIYRGDEGTGWSLAWKVNCWARFLDGDHALRLVNKLLSNAVGATGEHGGVYPNMFDAHPPFQIDGNFGAAAGIAEMLIQSQDSLVDILPALPGALPDGKVAGICARGGFVLDLSWKNGLLQDLTVVSRSGGVCKLLYATHTISVATSPGEQLHFDGQLKPISAEPRRDILIDQSWQTSLDTLHWKTVDIPHNWDDYYGCRRLRHGNLHGTALYLKTITVDKHPGLRYFLWFEGVGSYATVWVNDHEVGSHAGGRTSFTLDVTNALRTGKNYLRVRADHPAFIRDLPWVCGGCSEERGFSEGSQPLGIFRPVHLIVTKETRIEPFGVHIWNDTTVSVRSATLYLETELKNYGGMPIQGIITQQLLDAKGTVVAATHSSQTIGPDRTVTVSQQFTAFAHPHLWSTDTPYLYTLVTSIISNGQLIDCVTTPYGIRTIRWTDPHQPGAHPFVLNGQPVFINGIAEYEHRIGNSHAFTDEEIRARAGQIRAAGFNAFRDAHQPHNLRYQHYWDSLGILWWPQLSAHIWFDSPVFREHFKTALIEWVKERRNSPSVILWGLQNESKLPEDFARECTALIRQLDPTASSQRLVTTCNGGTGTDWDVPQNWTGTYGGDPATYGADLQRQILVGEYGGWRTIDLHGDTVYSEDRLDALMEQKMRLANSVRDDVAGHFAWVYSSHDNPGRVQSGEGLREIDRIGPVNYKGLLTSWEEPLDVYYLYRSNFVSVATAPMVYIVSHTWPDRWSSPGIKSGIAVYSNCEEVELFNDLDSESLGKRTRGGVGTHFQWDNVDIRYNVLYAVGYYHGRAAARDTIVLNNLPWSPHFAKLRPGTGVLSPAPGYHYLYRVNCGGPDYTDHEGHVWLADRHYTGGITWGSRSWTDDFPGLPAFFASQRFTTDPIAGTGDWPLFQDFRYGLQKLEYTFPVQDGDYRLELYFVEPWLGRGGGMNCSGWRSFDVAVNGKTMLKDLDIWKEAGHARALKKLINVHITGGRLVLGFPHIAAGQAVISALAIATLDASRTAAPPSAGIVGETGDYFLDTAYVKARTDTSVRVNAAADVYVGRDRRRYPADTTIAIKAGMMARITPVTNLEPAYDSKPVTSYKNARTSGDTTEWTIDVGVGDTYSLTVKYRWPAAPVAATLEVRMRDGTLIKTEPVTLATTLPAKWNYITTTTGTMVNAGRYTVRLIVRASEQFRVSELQVQ